MSFEKKEKFIVLNDAVFFDLILFVFFLTLTIMSKDYNPLARSIPLGLGILGSFMTFFQLLIDSFPKLRYKLFFVSQSGILGTENKTETKRMKPASEKAMHNGTTEALTNGKHESVRYEWLRVLRITIWLSGFIVLLGLTHYLIAVSAFIIGITRFEAKESWKRAVILTICIDISFFLLFDVILQAQL